jgi:hypothetical protein
MNSNSETDNAYVSSLKEDLNFNANQLCQRQRNVHSRSSYWPTSFHFSLPNVCNELYDPCPRGWMGYFHSLAIPYPRIWRTHGVSVFCGYFRDMWSTQMFPSQVSALMTIQAALFPGVHYALGAWYRGYELGRRGGCFTSVKCWEH